MSLKCQRIAQIIDAAKESLDKYQYSAFSPAITLQGFEMVIEDEAESFTVIVFESM